MTYQDIDLPGFNWSFFLGYEAISLFLLSLCLVIKLGFFFKRPCGYWLMLVLTTICSFVQRIIAEHGINSAFRYGSYIIWDDEVIRLSAIFFFLAHLIFIANWGPFKAPRSWSRW